MACGSRVAKARPPRVRRGAGARARQHARPRARPDRSTRARRRGAAARARFREPNRTSPPTCASRWRGCASRWVCGRKRRRGLHRVARRSRAAPRRGGSRHAAGPAAAGQGPLLDAEPKPAQAVPRPRAAAARRWRGRSDPHQAGARPRRGDCHARRPAAARDLQQALYDRARAALGERDPLDGRAERARGHAGAHGRRRKRASDGTRASRREVLGAEHEDTVASMRLLATMRAMLSDSSGRAERRYSVVAVQTRRIGSEHPLTLFGAAIASPPC